MAKLPTASVPQIYTALMSQIKQRIAALDKALARTQDPSQRDYGFADLELCYVQLRFCVELVAIAVLIAHNEHDEFRKKGVIKEWQATELLGKLGRISPDAFPMFFEIQPSASDPEMGDLIIDQPSRENRETLFDIYAECGRQLHIGSMSSLLRTKKRYVSSEILRHRNFIVNMLNNHAIILPGSKKCNAHLH